MSASPLMLIIFDGLGINPKKEGNAFAQARKATFDELEKSYPHSQLLACGKYVGLPDNQMGNSEVGHMNMGAGRIIYQDLTRIDRNIEQGQFFKNEVLLSAFKKAKKANSKLHFMGLISDGGVHSHQNHLFALLKLAKQEKVNKVFIHCFLDGRDTPPSSSLKFLSELENQIQKIGVGKIASLCGRYYAMDRDKRWDRIKLAYDLLTRAQSPQFLSYKEAIEKSYKEQVTDEFVKPVIVDAAGKIEDRDVVVFFNFRPDRARQITRTFTEKNFTDFERYIVPKLSEFVCFTTYDKQFTLPIAFPPTHHINILPEMLSHHKIKQFRCAETEKYAHVTYFFNCGREKPFDLEERCLVPSKRDVPTYDLKPEMSAYEITEAVTKALNQGQHDFYCVNFANPDMVGHTGNFNAAVKAVEVSDECLGKILKVLFEKNGQALITSDHGNVEQMIYYDTKKPHTAHTLNPVPLYLASKNLRKAKLQDGILSDVSPTVLNLLEIEKPQEMTQSSLLENKPC